MISANDFENGDEVWIIVDNRTLCMTGFYIDPATMQVCGGRNKRHIDHCYYTELEAIEAQIHYWNEMRLQRIVSLS